jgi:hypothetical protein
MGDLSGGVNCFDAKGNLRWVFVGVEGQMGPVLIADLYQAPGQEIIVTSHNGHIYALNSAGEYLWDLYHPQEVMPWSLPVLADVETDGIPEIYIGGGLHHFLRIDPRGPKLVLNENVHLHVNTALCAGDINLDGKDEVIFGNKGGKVFCYGSEGFRWTREFQHTSMSSSPLLLNVDSDAELELMFTFNGTQVLDTDGTILAELTNPTCNAPALVGDFDRDGFLDQILAGNGMMNSSGLTLYRWNIPYKEDPRQWTDFAGNRAHSGRLDQGRVYDLLETPQAVPHSSVVPVKMGVDTKTFSGLNTWRFDVGRNADDRVTLLNEIRFPSGKVFRFANHIKSENERVSFQFTADETGKYEVERKLVDPDRAALLLRQNEIFEAVGPQRDLEYIDEVLTETNRVVEEWNLSNPRVANHFENELLSLSGQTLALKSAPPTEDGSSFSKTIGDLRSKAARLQSLSASGKALAATATFAVWQSPPWSYFHPVETLPPAETGRSTIRRTLCQDEFDSLALNLTNFSGRTLNVRVFADDLKCGTQTVPAIECIEFRRTVMVPTNRGEEVADALPKLDQGSLLPISPLETSQLWLTLNASGLAPGTYTTTLHLKSVEPGETHLTVPVELTIANLSLPRPRPLRFCVWAFSWNWPDYLHQDLIDHGVTVHFGVSPKGECDENGDLIGNLDFIDHDAAAKRLSPHGMLLFVGSQGSLTGQPFLSEAWKKGYIAYLRAWVDHLKKIGLGYEDFALYPYDEPSTPHNQTTLNLVEVAKIIREADPKILIYTDPTSGTNRETLKMFEGLIDIWCPSSELLERFGEEILPFAKKVGKETWFYDAAGRARTLSCLGIYRWRFWYAWNLGLTGAGWWTYKYDIDLWQGRSEGGDHFYHVYNAPGEVVTSKRWEATREGIEDYEILYLLREEIRKAEARGVSEEVLSSSKKLIEELPKQIEESLHSAGRRLPLNPDSVPQYDRITETLDEARMKIIEECLRVQSH